VRGRGPGPRAALPAAPVPERGRVLRRAGVRCGRVAVSSMQLACTEAELSLNCGRAADGGAARRRRRWRRRGGGDGDGRPSRGGGARQSQGDRDRAPRRRGARAGGSQGAAAVGGAGAAAAAQLPRLLLRRRAATATIARWRWRSPSGGRLDQAGRQLAPDHCMGVVLPALRPTGGAARGGRDLA
jgi:hypothetical protein